MTELELPDPERLISAILTSHQWPRGYSRQEGTPSSLRRSPVASTRRPSAGGRGPKATFFSPMSGALTASRSSLLNPTPIVLPPESRCLAAGGEDLEPYLFAVDVESVNPTPIVLELMERCVAAGGRGARAKVFLRHAES